MIIKPDEVKTKAMKAYGKVLIQSVQGKTIIERNDRNIGKQYFPDEILFETLDDLLKFLCREKEYNRYIYNKEKIITEFPQLIPWVEAKPQKVIEADGKWNDIIKVCKYFYDNPRPCLFIREIPLDISTKFIEENSNIISSILDILIEEYINKEEKDFSKRYNLKYDEPLVRIRLLDINTARALFNGIDDLSIPQSKFAQLDLPCKIVYIVENKTNIHTFLTFPPQKDSIAIFGKGFGISILKNTTWLCDKQIIYWGDIDSYGFQILSQMRGYFPQTKSCMMDLETFLEFNEITVTGTHSTVKELPNLTCEEHMLFEHLSSLEKNNRLEQEKIPQSYVHDKIRKLSSQLC